jgi:hypothetical protein
MAVEIEALFQPARQTRSVLILAVIAGAIYFPVASMVAGRDAPLPIEPPGARRILKFQKLVPDGFAYISPSPLFREFEDDDAAAQKSPVIIFENGKPLERPHSFHHEVEKIGRGRYSHWKDLGFLLSTSDNSDPNSNHRAYWAWVPPPRQ